MTGLLTEVRLPFAELEQALRPLVRRAEGLSPASGGARGGSDLQTNINKYGALSVSARGARARETSF